MKRAMDWDIVVILLGLMLATALVVSCAVPTPTPSPDVDKTAYVSEINKTLIDGRTITCLVFDYGLAVGFSCDWGHE